MDDHYKILELTEDDRKLPTKEFKSKVKANYRRLSKIHHPDAGGSDEMFKKLNEANSILQDDDKRAEYDNRLRFGNPNHERSYGRANRTFRSEMTVKIEALSDPNNIIEGKIFNEVPCNECYGTGGSDKRDCDVCSGLGHKSFGKLILGCVRCGGTGKINCGCSTCGGYGSLTEKIDIVFTVSDIMIHGGGLFVAMDYPSGKSGSNYYGYIILNISIEYNRTFYHHPHSITTILSDIELPYYDYILGTTRDIKTLNGKTLRIKIPPKQSELRIKGHGVHISDKICGDMHIKINVVFPSTLSDSEKEYLEKIRDLKNYG